MVCDADRNEKLILQDYSSRAFVCVVHSGVHHQKRKHFHLHCTSQRQRGGRENVGE